MTCLFLLGPIVSLLREQSETTKHPIVDSVHLNLVVVPQIGSKQAIKFSIHLEIQKKHDLQMME